MHPMRITDDPRAGVLEIDWDDGSTQQFRHGFLRSHCQCADCKTVRLQGRHQAAASNDIRIREIRPTGAYGLQLIFSDGHERGIYPWAYLRQLPDNDG